MGETSSLLTRLKSYAHLGELAFSEEEVQKVIKSAEDDYRHKLCSFLLRAVKEKDADTLKKFKGLYQVTYQRDSFFDKLFHRKNHPQITLTASLDQILKRDNKLWPNYVSALKNADDELHRLFQIRLKDRKKAQKEQDKQKRFQGRPFQDNEDDNIAAINPEYICLVHATDYYPKKNNKGEYEIQTLATATHLKYPRNTIHFALNHYVGSHIGGNWTDKPYVVLTPLTDISELNGRNPAGVSAVDTFFEMDVNENLKLPKETTFIIEPAPPVEKIEEGKKFKMGLHRAFYKTTFSEKERKDLVTFFKIENNISNFKDLPIEQQNAVLASKVKEELVTVVLEQKGYKNLDTLLKTETITKRDSMNYGKRHDWNCPKDALPSKVARLGKRLKAFSATHDSLHHFTIFGADKLCERNNCFSCDTVGELIDFIDSVTHADGFITCEERGGYFFTDKKGEKHWADSKTLEKVYETASSNKNYLQCAEDFVEEKLKNPNVQAVLTDRSQHVLDVWRKHQRELWNKSAPTFFKRYPTLQAFEKAFNRDKPVPVHQPTGREGTTR